jgi:threonine aldolase
MQLASKMRYVSAQLVALLDGDLWLRNAAHANACARRLADGLARLPGARLAHPCDANEVFVELPEAVIARLEQAGAGFHRWGGPASAVVRFVCAFDAPEADIDRLLAHAAAA